MDILETNLANNHTPAHQSKFDNDISVTNYVNSVPIVSSPLAQCLIVLVYLGLVLVILPRYMANRQPYQLKSFVHVYNVSQIVMNIWLCYLHVELMNNQPLKFWDNICSMVTSVNDASDHTVYLKIIRFSHLYCMNKTMDLLDTIIFCLKKKQSQVTFLHVYHHVMMMFSSWITFFYFRVELNSTLAALNSLVHIVMYTYYFLANLGPSVRKYLWWKSYVTKLQIIQFLVIITLLAKLRMEGCKQSSYYAAMWVFTIQFLVIITLLAKLRMEGCKQSSYYAAMWVFTVGSILLLFCDFYSKTYKRKKQPKFTTISISE